MRTVLLAAVIVAFAVGAIAEDGGLFAEQITVMDGVKVRRIRDTKEDVVCYVASGGGSLSGYVDGTLVIPSISCLREAK